MVLPVVLHPDVIEFLRTEFQNNLQESTWKCIDKLRQQNFDGSLRVKRLHGVSKRVWEARITRAIRLIFTYEKSINNQTREPQVCIAVQDICLDHDDVARRAKARKRTPDASWLDAVEVKTIGDFTDDRDDLTEDEQLAVWDAIDQESQADLQTIEDVDELLSNIQWQVLESESEWHRAIVQQDEDLPLRLSLEEKQIIEREGNLLLSGSAGTGKTTVGLYRLIGSLQTLPPGKRLYVAYNPILVAETRKQFTRLLGKEFAEVLSWFEFKTIRDLCWQMSDKTLRHYRSYDEVDYRVFESIYGRHAISKKYPPTLVWDEIRSIIKGSYLATERRLFSLPEYQDLGKRRSSVIAQNERGDIYKIALWYQDYLSKKKRFDEIDLARQALKQIQTTPPETYQAIVCDEVQDLTELQIHLLLQLADRRGNLFFAGDLHQMISPSGFRWEDLGSQFYKSDRPVIKEKLHFNFRSVGSLVCLANKLLDLRSRLLNEKIERRETDVYRAIEQNLAGDKSIRSIVAATNTIDLTLQELYSADAILVRTLEQKETLASQLNSSFVFTIEEAKGLEFDTVFLVDFFLPQASLWQKAIKGIPALKEREIPQLRLELNLLYVAVTRARRILNIWENKLALIWQQPEIISLISQTDWDSIQQERLASTAQMWQERGLYYLELQHYRQALECFQKSGDTQLQWQASARLFLQTGQYDRAAEFFIKLENWQEAARLLMRIKQWQKAAFYWHRGGNFREQQKCKIYALESENKWQEAARSWEQIQQTKEARRCWLKSDNEPKKIAIRTSYAKYYEQNQQWLEAAEQYRLAKIYDRAAWLFETAEQWAKAAKQYELAGISDKAIKCLAKYYESKKQWQLAAQQYQLGEMTQKASECLAKHYESEKQWQLAAQQYELAGIFQNAAKFYKRAQLPVKAAPLFEKSNQWYEASQQYLQAKQTKKAIECKAKYFVTKQQWSNAIKEYKLIGMSEQATYCQAKNFELLKQWQKAANCWGRLGNIKRQKACQIQALAVNQKSTK